MRGSHMRRVLFNLLLYPALTSGVFVAILGVTGAIMAFETELDHVLHARLSYVKPQGRAMSLAEIGAAVVKQFPGERIGGYSIATDPGLSYGVSLRRGLVAVNQYTGEVLGVRPGGPDFLARVHQLHLRLLILGSRADPGKTVMSWAGVVILFLALSGLYLWWPYQRVRISKGAKGFRYWFDLHNSVGILSLVFLVILAFTGVMIGFEEHTVPMFYKLSGSAPSPRPGQAPPPAPGAKAISPDEAIEIARQAIPGTAPFQVNVPGPRGYYQIRSRFPEDLTPGGRSFVVVDQYSGTVVFAEGSRTAPAGARMVIQNRAIHTGDIFGIPSKTLASLVCLALVMQLVSGLWMWGLRKTR